MCHASLNHGPIHDETFVILEETDYLLVSYVHRLEEQQNFVHVEHWESREAILKFLEYCGGVYSIPKELDPIHEVFL